MGLAGFAGVAASGVVIARSERQRRAYTPQEVRERLHARLAEAPEVSGASPPASGSDAVPSGPRARLRALASRYRPRRPAPGP